MSEFFGDTFVAQGYLDVNDRHPELFGDCILLRDDDAMGFALCLEPLIGKHVRITIEEVPAHGLRRLWRTDAEKKAARARKDKTR